MAFVEIFTSNDTMEFQCNDSRLLICIDISQLIIVLYKSSMPPKKAFYSEMDSFTLTVTLIDGKLSVEIKDFVKWVVYSGDFTKNTIYQKNQPEEVFKCLQRSSRFAKHNNSFCKVSHYEFDDFLRVKDHVYYIVKHEQLIVNMSESFAHYCYLPLQTTRELTAIQLSNKFQTSALSNKFLYLNQALNANDQIKSKISTEVQNFNKQNQYYKNKLETKTKLIKQKINTEFKVLQFEVTDPNHHSSVVYQLSQEYPFLKLANQRTRPFFSFDYKDLTPFDDTELKIKLKELQLKQHFTNLLQKNISLFKFDRLKLQTISGSSSPKQYIFNRAISPNEHYKFKLKIISLKDFGMLIGVVDYLSQKNEINSFQSGYSYSYSCEGFLFPDFQPVGTGYKQGDIVQVDVDRATGTILYNVNGVLQATDKNAKVMGDTCLYMPYVEMTAEKNTVQWILEEIPTYDQI